MSIEIQNDAFLASMESSVELTSISGIENAVFSDSVLSGCFGTFGTLGTACGCAGTFGTYGCGAS